MTGSARANLQRVWSSLRSINVDGEDNVDSARNSMLGKWTPRSSSSDNDKEGGGTLENVVRSMFGSCVAMGGDQDEPSLTEDVPVRPRERSKSRGRRRSSSAGVRAQQAVYNLLEKAEERETSPSQRKPSVSRTSPRKQVKQEVPYLVHEVGPPPPPPNAPHLATDATFDDGISAISAHTLEELDRQHKLKKPHDFNTVQSDLTQEQGFETSLNKTVSNESAEERDRITSPIDMSRERSNTTWGTNGTRRTYQSMSTESTDFEKVWRQEEQKYWQDAVEKDEKRTPMRRGGSFRRLDIANSRVRSRSREQVSLLNVAVLLMSTAIFV